MIVTGQNGMCDPIFWIREGREELREVAGSDKTFLASVFFEDDFLLEPLPLRTGPVLGARVRTLASKRERYDLPGHLAVYILSTIAILLLLYEQSQLSSRAGIQPVGLVDVLVAQTVMGALLVLIVVAFGRVRRRWVYALSTFLFAGYAVTRLTAAFTATIGLVPILQSKGVPISDYQGTFYLLALASAFSYLLSILLLRRSYGKLVPTERLNQVMA